MVKDLPQEEVGPMFVGSALDFITRFDEHLFNGTASLHKWQIEQLEEISAAKPSIQHPYRLALVAANSSGKDKYIIAPFCIWFILTRVDATCIVTSSSAQQLDTQTEKYLRRLAQAFNAEVGSEVIRVVKRKIYCSRTRSEIICFATDEAGKAEGYHPVTPTADMAIVTNESKSIPDEIFEALLRCSGYKYWLEISSPGQPSGNFYRSWCDEKDFYHKRRVTSYECPHISTEEIEFDADKFGGKHTAMFRSKHLALFTSVDQQVVISRDNIDKWIAQPIDYIPGRRRAGFDIAAGGDENIIQIIDGNTLIHTEHWITPDTTVTANRAIATLRRFEVDPAFCFADDNNVGRGVINTMRDLGYEPNRFLAQWAAINKKDFLNRGAEVWWQFARLWEKGLIRLSKPNEAPDRKLIDQLCSRKYLQPGGGKIRLVSKLQMKADGIHSPDRADALVLAFVGVTEADLTRVSQAQGGVRTSVASTNSLIEKQLDRLMFNREHAHDEVPERKMKLFKHPGLLLNAIRKASRL